MQFGAYNSELDDDGWKGSSGRYSEENELYIYI